MRSFAVTRTLLRALPLAQNFLVAAAITVGFTSAFAEGLQGVNQHADQTANGSSVGTLSPFSTVPNSVVNGSAGNYQTNGLPMVSPLQAGVLPTGPQSQSVQNTPDVSLLPPPPPYVPGEFESYVQELAGTQEVRRLGAGLMDAASASTSDTSPLVPPDYLIMPGDELDVAVWGSVDAQAQLIVDRTGRISLPHVGTFMVAGTRYADLPALFQHQIGQQFRDFKVSVALGQLRGMRVYVSGFVMRPGGYTVSSLTTVSSALVNAGGPKASGSFRNIEVRRHGAVVAKFDLYDLVLDGKRNSDIVLQPDDVIQVGPVGTQVGVIGSVNQPVIAELLPGENLADAIRMAGGLSSVADSSRITIEPLNERNAERVIELSLPQSGSYALKRGDVVRVFSSIDARQPTVKPNKRVIVEGEVMHPGMFVMPPHATLADVLVAAGGLTANAFVYGTEFTRASVKVTQRQNYDKVLRDLEVDLEQSISTEHVSNSDEAKAQNSRSASLSRLLEKLRTIQPTGRVVLMMEPDAKSLPPMPIEDYDRLYVPPAPTSVGVFGSVYNTGNFIYSPTHTIGDYVDIAGGPTRGADKPAEFVLRANGSVVSNLQRSRWFHPDYLDEVTALPGDTIFIPEELDKMNALDITKDWTQVLYQFGLGLAGISLVVK